MMKQRSWTRALAVMALLIALSGAMFGSAVAAPKATGSDGATKFGSAASYCADSEEQAFLTQINNYRRSVGLNALQMTQQLGAAAEHHSVDMANLNYFSHTLADGTSWSLNMTNHGYPTNTWRAENIAAGNSTASATFTQWRNSPGHDTNMRGVNYNAIGIGRAYNEGSTYKWYWTTVFGNIVDGPASLCGSTTVPTTVPTIAPTAVPTRVATAVPTVAPTVSAGGTVLRIMSSTRTSNSNSSTYAYDNRPTTSWNTISSAVPTSAYVYFDLGSTKSIRTIRWMFSAVGSADAFTVQVSNNRTSWTTLASRTNAPTANSWQSLSVSTSARYVRFYFTNPARDRALGFLNEVQIAS